MPLLWKSFWTPQRILSSVFLQCFSRVWQETDGTVERIIRGHFLKADMTGWQMQAAPRGRRRGIRYVTSAIPSSNLLPRSPSVEPNQKPKGKRTHWYSPLRWASPEKSARWRLNIGAREQKLSRFFYLFLNDILCYDLFHDCFPFGLTLPLVSPYALCLAKATRTSLVDQTVKSLPAK